MVSSWTDAIVVSRTPRGMFGVYSRKQLDASEGGRWITLGQDTGLATPVALLAAIREAECLTNSDVEWDEALPKVAELDWAMGAALANALERDVPVPPKAKDLPAQGRFRKSDVVTVSVPWDNEEYSLDVPIHLWAEVCAGKSLRRRSRQHYEGTHFGLTWNFDITQEDALVVASDEGGGDWENSLDEAYIHGPEVFGLNMGKLMVSAAIKDLVEGETKCPYCGSREDCGHLLLIVDKTFRNAEGGVLCDAFNDRWSDIVEQAGEDFDEGDAFNELLEEVDNLAGVIVPVDQEGAPGMSSAKEMYFASSKAKAAEASRRFAAE
jgi:hypothetical protein